MYRATSQQAPQQAPQASLDPPECWGCVGATAGAVATPLRRYQLSLVPAVTLLFVTSPITLPYPIQDSLRPPPKPVRRRALR